MERWRNLETKDLVHIRLDHKRVLFETKYLNTPHLCLCLQLGELSMPASEYGGKPLDVWWQLLLSWLLGGLRQLTPKYVSMAHGLFWIQLFKKQPMQGTLWPSFLSPQNQKISHVKGALSELEVERHLCLQKWRIWGRKADINKPYYFFNLLLLPKCCLDPSLR